MHINNEAEACAAILMACRRADEFNAEAENPLLRTILSTRNVFIGHDTDALLEKAAQNYADAGSPEKLIDASLAKVREQTRLPLLYHCLDLIFSNGLVTPREHQVFQYIKGKFKVSDAKAFQALEVLQVKSLL